MPIITFKYIYLILGTVETCHVNIVWNNSNQIEKMLPNIKKLVGRYGMFIFLFYILYFSFNQDHKSGFIILL